VEARVHLATPGPIDPADEAQIMHRVSNMLETLTSDDTMIADPKHFILVNATRLVDGWLRLRMSRILWLCLPANRGWAGVEGDVIGEEGREVYFEPDVRSVELGFCYDDSDDERGTIVGTPRS